MPVFNFTAIGKNGKEVGGSREAKDRFELARLLRADGMIAISVKESLEMRKWSIHSLFFEVSRIGIKEKSMFTSNLGIMIEAGLSLSRALGVLGRQTKNAKLKSVIKSITDDVSKGQTLSKALARLLKNTLA